MDGKELETLQSLVTQAAEEAIVMYVKTDSDYDSVVMDYIMERLVSLSDFISRVNVVN